MGTRADRVATRKRAMMSACACACAGGDGTRTRRRVRATRSARCPPRACPLSVVCCLLRSALSVACCPLRVAQRTRRRPSATAQSRAAQPSSGCLRRVGVRRNTAPAPSRALQPACTRTPLGLSSTPGYSFRVLRALRGTAGYSEVGSEGTDHHLQHEVPLLRAERDRLPEAVRAREPQTPNPLCAKLA